MGNIIINGKDYKLISHYKHDKVLRGSFNALTQKVYDFDFEKWYTSGYWADNCILYSLLDNVKVISHITVTVIDFIVLGKKKRFVQLGTVMTDKGYRNQGLSRILMEKVLDDWENKCDMIYLYANDSVLDFYPKFGFVPVDEYQAIKAPSKTKMKKDYSVRNMDMHHAGDRALLYETAKNNMPLFKISMCDNAGLIMFYSNYFDLFSLKDNIFYIEDLNAIAIAEYEENDLIVYDILATQKVNIDDVIDALTSKKTKEVILGSMPINSNSYEISLFKEENATLFVKGDESKLFNKNKLCFPMLSHT